MTHIAHVYNFCLLLVLQNNTLSPFIDTIDIYAMATGWSLSTFFTHQPETSSFQPTSEQGANIPSIDSVVASNPSSDVVPTQLTTTASSNDAQPGEARTVVPSDRSVPFVNSTSSGPPELIQDSSRAASSKEVENGGTRGSGKQLGTSDVITMRAVESSDQALPTPSKSSITWKSYLDLPLEIRQHILSYIVNPEDTSIANAAITLTHRSAMTLSQVSRQVRLDTNYVHSQWRKTHKLQDIMNCSIWTKDDQQILDELTEMVGYDKGLTITQAQIDFVGALQIRRLLQTLNMYRAQKMETRNMIDQLRTTVGMQREVNQELREENEKLVLALEMRDMELGLELQDN